MRFLVQAAIIFVILWFVPELGAWGGHAKTGIITLAASCGSLLVTFAADLVAAPSQIDRDQVKEIRHLREAIEGSMKVEALCADLSELWSRGAGIAEEDRDAWTQEVTDFVEKNLPSQEVHKLKVAKFSGHDRVLEFLNVLASSPYPGGTQGKLRTIATEYIMWSELGDSYTDNTGTRDFRDRAKA